MSNMDPDLLEKWSIEFKKGFAKPILLLFLEEKENYAYSLSKEISAKTHGQINIAGSNIYPLLSSMTRQGLIEASAGSGDSKRKVYRLTARGRDFLDNLRQEMGEFLDLIQAFIGV